MLYALRSKDVCRLEKMQIKRENRALYFMRADAESMHCHGKFVECRFIFVYNTVVDRLDLKNRERKNEKKSAIKSSELKYKVYID